MKSTILWLLLFVFLSHIAEGQKDLTGTWSTDGQITYMVEITEHEHTDSKIHHRSVKREVRSAEIQFELTQTSDGYITGTNKWTSFDKDGNQLLVGTEPLIGSYDGKKRAIITEPGDEIEHSIQIVFEIEVSGKNKLSVLGYSVGDSKILAMKFDLFRK